MSPHRLNPNRPAAATRRTRRARPLRPSDGPRAQPTVPASGDQDGRQRILSVAIRSFADLGYEGTTTAGIARDAGVTQPLVHHHFGSKERLWRAAMDAVFSNAVRVGDVPADASPRDQFLAITERFVRFAAAHPEATRVMGREGATPSPRLTYLVDHYLREPFQRLVAVTRAGQRTGGVAADLRPDLLLFLILGAGSHLFDATALARESLGIDANAPATQNEFAALLERLLTQGVMGHSPQPRRTKEHS